MLVNKNPHAILLIILIGGAFIAIVVVGLMVLAHFDKTNTAIKKAPGYNFVYSKGELLTTSKADSVSGAGASLDRYYGLHISKDEAAADLKHDLSALGYTQPDARVDRYVNGKYVIELIWLAPDSRILGRYYTEQNYTIVVDIRLTAHK